MYAVYRVFDAVDECLYVGCSPHPWERMATHVKAGRFELNDVRSMDFTWVESHREALTLERREIRRLQPKHNVRSLRPYKRRPSGELLEAVRGALMAADGPTTSVEICKAIGFSTPTNIATILIRLREQGFIEKIGTAGGPGRQAFLYRVVEVAA